LPFNEWGRVKTNAERGRLRKFFLAAKTTMVEGKQQNVEKKIESTRDGNREGTNPKKGNNCFWRKEGERNQVKVSERSKKVGEGEGGGRPCERIGNEITLKKIRKQKTHRKEEKDKQEDQNRARYWHVETRSNGQEKKTQTRGKISRGEGREWHD